MILRVMLAVAIGAALSSCASYYAIEATLPASVPETSSALETAVRNISDFSVIPDATPVSDSATLRYIGLQGFPVANGRFIRTMPKFAIRLQPEGSQSTMAVTSVGGDEYAKMVIVATEQELQHRALVRTDSGYAPPPGALPFKSTLLHQVLNAATPMLGMFYVQRDNPYTSPGALSENIIVGATDAAGLYLMATNIKGGLTKVSLKNEQPAYVRSNQYKFVIGLVISSILRYQYGSRGFLELQQYNALADSPYNLQSNYIDDRVASIGISVRFP